ncbi:MAG: OmpA family protein [Campylobacteraceae bacterium]|nr:OmpA family protein [Campylobacteraceae bacterium]
MSPAKKIFFLCLALIILIVLCVNMHLEKLSKNTSIEQVQESKPIPVAKEIQKEEPKQEVVTNEEPNKEEPLKEELTSSSLKESSENQIKDELKISKEEPVKEEIIDSEEKTEDEPLITTDKKYKRTGNEKPIEEMSINTQLLQIRIRDYVTKYPITFRTSSNQITKKSLNTISTVVKILKNYPTLKIEVAGHTDAAGSKKYNLGVSISRAVAVKKQMIAYGFDKNRIKARGYGENIPIVENNAKGYSKVNRRVEFNIIEE